MWLAVLIPISDPALWVGSTNENPPALPEDFLVHRSPTSWTTERNPLLPILGCAYHLQTGIMSGKQGLVG